VRTGLSVVPYCHRNPSSSHSIELSLATRTETRRVRIYSSGRDVAVDRHWSAPSRGSRREI
jgi:hypothetical protein